MNFFIWSGQSRQISAEAAAQIEKVLQIVLRVSTLFRIGRFQYLIPNFESVPKFTVSR